MERREGSLTGKYFVNIKDNQFLVFIIPNVNAMESIHNCYAPPLWRKKKSLHAPKLLHLLRVKYFSPDNFLSLAPALCSSCALLMTSLIS